MDQLIKYLKALVYLQAQSLSGEGAAVKAEILLANAGLSYKEIAEILGKNEAAVAKAVSRGRGTQKKGGKNE